MDFFQPSYGLNIIKYLSILWVSLGTVATRAIDRLVGEQGPQLKNVERCHTKLKM